MTIFIYNFKSIKDIFKITRDNILKNNRFIFENKEYSVLGNIKYLIRFMFYYILNMIILVVSFSSLLAMWFSLGMDRFNLMFSIFSLIFLLYASFSILDEFNKMQENFKKHAISIDELKDINYYEKCKEFIKAKKYKLNEEDAQELNSYYHRVYNINEDCFLSYNQELILLERSNRNKKNK